MIKSVKIVCMGVLLSLLGAVMGATQAWSQSAAPESVMTQNADGTWTVHKQVPLVGEGRVVNNLVETVSVLPIADQHLENLVDTDLSNTAKFQGAVANIDLVDNEIVSVKDINRVYKAGQKVGFVFVQDEGLLNLEVLSKGFVFNFYKKGSLVESVPAVGKGDNVLNLELLSFKTSEKTSDQIAAVTAPVDFDEVGISNAGLLDANVLNKPLEIKYFFVGENPEIPVVESSFFPSPSIHEDGGVFPGEKNWTGGWTLPAIVVPVPEPKDLINNDLTDWIGFSTLGGLFGSPHVTVNFGKTIPENYEVGFKVGADNLLSLGLFSGTEIKTFAANASGDANKNSTGESVEITQLVGASLISGGKQSLRMVTTKECGQVRLKMSEGINVDLGVTRVYYAYVRKPVTVGPEAYLSLADDTIYSGEGYQFYINKKYKDKVTFRTVGTDVGSPDFTVTNDGVIHGMINDGRYTVKATLTVGEETYVQTATITKITRNVQDECNNLITKEGDNAKIVAPIGGEGCLLCIGSSSSSNADNLIDGKNDTYATVDWSLVDLSKVQAVAALTFDKITPPEGQSYRAGFTMQFAPTLLSLNTLKFFYIRLYDGNTMVLEAVPGENQTIGLDLIGSSQEKVRFTVTTNQAFDRMELWYAGVLNLSLGKAFRLYNAFWEPDNSTCRSYSLAEVCMENINYRTGASLWLEKTGFGDISQGTLVQVAGVIRGLGNIIDNDINNYALVHQTVSANIAGEGFSIGIKLDKPLTVPAGGKRQFGFIVRVPSGILDLGLLDAMKVSLYRNGVEIAHNRPGGGILDLDLIGFGDKNYIEATLAADDFSASEVDAMTFSIAGIEVLKDYQIYGVYTRLDSDGDDIPDCIKPEEELEISVQPDVINECVDETGTKTVELTISSKNKITAVYCEFYSYDRTSSTGYSINKDYSKAYNLGEVVDGKQTLTLSLEVDDYMIRFKDKDNNYYISTDVPHITIHPLETTWKPYEGSTDWNDWGNWDKGSPWTCTDVIIPTVAQVYPLLESGVLNGCHYIHFEPNTEVVNTHYLTYTKAWVEMALNPNRYYMVSVPLKSVYSGDWFLPKVELRSDQTVTQENINSSFTVPYFTDLNETTLPANRVQPTVFQRVWEKTVLNRLPDTGQAPVYPTYKSTNWTKPYNWLATPYDKADGYDFNALSVWVHPFRADFTDDDPSVREDLSYKFRFPKEHTQYFYYDEEGNIRSESARLTRKNVGRFIYEQDDQTAKFPITMRYKNEGFGEGHQVFLAGNPFMTHIKVAKLFEGNGHILSIKVYDGNTYISVIKKEDGTLSSLEEYASIAPMQSFFVEISSEDEENDECAITYTEDMLGSSPGTDLLRSVRGAAGGNIFRLTASAAGKEAGALLRFSASASDYYRDGEDADLLIDDEVPPVVALFTLAGERAVDIQQRASGGEIPLGFFLAKPEEMTLRLDVPEQCAGWTLVDAVNGKAYPLEVGLNEIELGRMTTNVGRFALRGDLPTGNGVITTSQPRIYCYREEGGTLVVRSVEGLMTQCEVYTVAGQLLGMARHETNEYRLPVASGAKIIRVTFADGISSTIKTF